MTAQHTGDTGLESLQAITEEVVEERLERGAPFLPVVYVYPLEARRYRAWEFVDRHTADYWRWADALRQNLLLAEARGYTVAEEAFVSRDPNRRAPVAAREGVRVVRFMLCDAQGPLRIHVHPLERVGVITTIAAPLYRLSRVDGRLVTEAGEPVYEDDSDTAERLLCDRDTDAGLTREAGAVSAKSSLAEPPKPLIFDIRTHRNWVARTNWTTATIAADNHRAPAH